VDSGQELSTDQISDTEFEYSLFLRVLDLETDVISILDLALSKSKLLLHELDHARFDSLQESRMGIETGASEI